MTAAVDKLMSNVTEAVFNAEGRLKDAIYHYGRLVEAEQAIVDSPETSEDDKAIARRGARIATRDARGLTQAMTEMLTFDKLRRKRVDLLNVNPKRCVFQIGYRLQGYSFHVSSAPVMIHDERGVRIEPTDNLELEDHARLYTATKRARPRLARVRVEPCIFSDKQGRHGMETIEPLTGYQLRDVTVDHVWLTMGVHRSYRHDLGAFTFAYTPPT
jgi:hypothetical protein